MNSLSTSVSAVIPKYSKYQPTINLEVLSAKSAKYMLLLNAVTFISCFIIDTLVLFQGFRFDNTIYPSPFGQSCNQTDLSMSYTLNETIYDVPSLFTFSAYVTETNFTNLVGWEEGSKENVCSPVTLKYDVELWSCKQAYGCGASFSSEENYDYFSDKWLLVYSSSDEKISTNMCILKKVGIIKEAIVPLAYQYQKSIPGVSLIKSYFIKIRYYENPTLLFVPTTKTESISYTTEFATDRINYLAVAIVSIVCFLVVFISLLYFLKSLHKYEKNYKKWLPEQRWTLTYLFFFLFSLNPMKSVVIFTGEKIQHPEELGLAVYICDAVGSAGIILTWLLMTSPIMAREYSFLQYYTPRLLSVLVYLTSQIFLSCIIFPPSMYINHGPTTFLHNWPYYSYEMFVLFLFIFFAASVICLLYGLYNIFCTLKSLENLNYLSNRYIHLSFRYFIVNALLYFFQYASSIGVLIIYIQSKTDVKGMHSFAIFGLINLQTNHLVLYGRLITGSIIGLIFVFCYLPYKSLINEKDYQGNMRSKLVSTFVITEDEMIDIVEIRKKQIEKFNSMQKSLANNVANFNPYVCCIDKAINLLGVCLEVYYDQPGQPTPGGCGHDENDLKDMDLESLGYSYIASYNDETHDTFCCIARHEQKRQLVVAFRGTSSLRNWNTNSKYYQTAFNLKTLLPKTPLPTPFVSPQLIIQQDINANTFSKINREINHKHVNQESKISELNKSSSIETETTRNKVNEIQISYHNNNDNYIKLPHNISSSSYSLASSTSSTSFHTAYSPSKFASNFQIKSFNNIENINRKFVHRDSNSSEQFEFEYKSCDEGLDDDKNILNFSISILSNLFRLFLGYIFTSFLGVFTILADVIGKGFHSAAKRLLKNQPGFRNFVNPYVHRGFVDAYLPVREFIHSTIRNELLKELGDVIVTGHSLGGALAGLCAMDIEMHTLAPINLELKTIQNKKLLMSRKSITIQKLPSRLHLSLYSFGSPKIGNATWVNMYNKLVPDSFRIVVDGDIIPGLSPLPDYSHMGNYVLIDGLGDSGTIIVNPTFVERRFIIKTKASVTAHTFPSYANGLKNVVEAALEQNNGDTKKSTITNNNDDTTINIEEFKHNEEKEYINNNRNRNTRYYELSRSLSQSLYILANESKIVNTRNNGSTSEVPSNTQFTLRELNF